MNELNSVAWETFFTLLIFFAWLLSINDFFFPEWSDYKNIDFYTEPQKLRFERF